MARNIIHNKNYDDLNEILLSWYKSLCEREGLCIAISRKAPRLLEWCSTYFHKEKSLQVVSEIAIPFIDLSVVKSCSLVDEAIYHGTTYSKVFNLVAKSNPSLKVFAEPLVVTEEALSLLGAAGVMIEKDIPMITEGYANFFIDTVVKRFHEGLKPYDMEYPLLYVKLDKTIDDKFMMESLKRLEDIEKKTLNIDFGVCHYNTQTYSREHDSVSTSYSYVFEYRFGDNLNPSQKPDFAKLRFSIKDNLLCIAVMTPYIISDFDIENEGRIFTGCLLPIWTKIYSESLRHSIDDEEYQYQRKKSLVVLANYLLSFNNFLCMKENILLAFGATAAWLDYNDLRYLVGQKLSGEISSELNGINEPMHALNVFELSGIIAQRYIPYTHREAYQRKTGMQNILAESLHEKVSNLFSAMHWEVEVNSRLNTPDTYYSRLRFGESYESLAQILNFANSTKEGLRMELHKSIDSRIDSGSVVPNYVRIERLPNYWLRLFRSGENEDVDKDQQNRILLYMVRQYMQFSGNDTMPLAAVQMALLMMVYEDRGRYSKYFCRRVGFASVNNVASAMVEIGGEQFNLLDKVTINGLFGLTEQNSIVIKENTDTLRLVDGNPLSTDMEIEIRDIVSFVYDYCENIVNWDIIRIMPVFALLAFDRDKLIAGVEKWTKSIRNKVSEELEIDMEEEKKEFERLFSSMPNSLMPNLDADRGKWYAKIKILLDKYNSKSDEYSEYEKRLVRDFYVLNLWTKLNDSGNNLDAIPEELKDLFLNYFSEKEIEILSMFDSMTIEKAKAAALDMIR